YATPPLGHKPAESLDLAPRGPRFAHGGRGASRQASLGEEGRIGRRGTRQAREDEDVLIRAGLDALRSRRPCRAAHATAPAAALLERHGEVDEGPACRPRQRARRRQWTPATHM